MNANLKQSSGRNRMRLTGRAMIVVAVVALGQNVVLAQPKVPIVRKANGNMNYAPGRVLVKLNPAHAAAATARGKTTLPGVKAIESLSGPAAGANAKSTNESTWFVASLEDGTDVEKALKALAADPSVASVTPDFIHSIPRPIQTAATGAAADPDMSQQYALERIEAAAAWQIEAGKKSVVVAVVDTGAQMDHPDLAAQIWTNPRESANGRDDDGDGFVDDVHGWNFVSNNNDPSDDNHHGTHCSGIIAATRDNGQGVAGTANVSIMPVKVLNSEGSGSTSDIIKGMKYAVSHGASIISMSLGGGGYEDAFAQACSDAIAHNVVVIAASGNESAGQVGYPAAYEGVISVGATDSNDQIADFSNQGEGLTISAPGVDILSTVPGNKYELLSGTSMATPYVAGVAALIRSANPTMTVDQVRDRLTSTADDLGNPGYDTTFGAGRVNARKALANEANPNPSPSPTPTPAPGGNTSPDRALPIQNGQFTGTCRDELWYTFTLSRTAKVDITLSGNQGDLDLFLMDSNGEELGESVEYGSNEGLSGTLNAGKYLVAVAAYEGQGGTFTLSFNASGNDGRPTDPGQDPGDGFTPGTGDMCGAGSGMPLFAMIAGLMGFGATTRRRK